MTQSADVPSHWLVYAMGGGIGHVTRATALSRSLLQHSSGGDRITLLTNSSFAARLPIENELGERAEVMRIDSRHSRDRTVAEVQRVFKTALFHAVIVDTFPRGIAGELAEILPGLNCRKVLIHRDLNPKYCQQFRLSEFVGIYDRLIVPGEAAPFENLPNTISTSPWLVRNDSELLQPDDARRRLAVKGNKLPVAVVLGCGRAEEIEQMQAWAMQLADEFPVTLEVRFVVINKSESLDRQEIDRPNFKIVSIWPFFQAIRGASIVISGGGYNSVNEARAAGIPFCGIPRKRLYDRQYKRIASSDCVERFEDLRTKIESSVLNVPTQSKGKISFCNGVHEAVEVIQGLVS